MGTRIGARRMRGRIPVAGLAVLLALAAPRALRPAAAGEPEKPLSPWRDPALIERRLAEACEAVESVCGAKFEKRPTVRVSTGDEVKAVLERELKPVLAAMGMADQLPSVLDFYAVSVLGKYEPGAHVIHVLPGNAEKLAKALGDPPPSDDELRVVLAHEATHALDFTLYPLVEMEGKRSTVDGQKALAAVVEGHAQWVAEQAAARWGIESAFQRFTKSITALPPLDDPNVRRVAESLVAEAGFAYVQGHAFVKAVAAARGRDGVEQLLKEPPAGTLVVEHPEKYLAAAAGSPSDLEGVLDAMRPLVGDPVWKVTTTRMLEATLRVQGQSLPPEQRKTFLDGYEDGRLVVAQVAEEGAQVVLMALGFDSATHAGAFLSFEREGAKKKSETTPTLRGARVTFTFSEGAGRGGTLPGYAVRAVAGMGDEETVVYTQATAIGTTVIEMMVVAAPGLDRTAQDEALERASLRAADPAAFAAAPAARVPTLLRRTRPVTLRVLGPDGTPVPKASVSVEQGPHAATETVSEGRASFALRKAPASVTVYGTSDADGKPLALAPKTVRIEAEAAEAEVRLEAGVAIEGVVLTEARQPLAGAVVEAIPEGDSGMPASLRFSSGEPVHGRAVSGADGAFRVVGLAPTGYVLRAKASSPAAASMPLKARGDATGVTLVVRLTPTVVLTLVDGKDAPVAGAFLSVSRREGRGARMTAFRGESDPAGTVEVTDLEASGRFDIEVHPPRSREDLARFSFSDWRPTESRLVFQPGFTVTGVVKDDKGSPVQARVLLKTPDGWESTETGADGAFKIPSLARAPVSVAAVAGAEDFLPGAHDPTEWTVVTPEAPTVVLRLGAKAANARGDDASSRVLTVRVVDPDGRPVTRGRVGFAAKDWSYQTDMRGSATPLRVRRSAGVVRVFATKDAAGGAPWGPAVKDVSADAAEVEVRLALGRAIRGRVVDDAGKGVPGARVRAVLADTPSYHAESDAEAEASSVADGTFRLEGLGDAQYRLSADEVPDPLFAESVAAAGGAENVTIALRRGNSVALTIVDWNDRPVPGATVEILLIERTSDGSWSVRGHRTDLETDHAGKIRDLTLDPKLDLHLSVQPPSDRDDLMSLPEGTWDRSKTRVVLGRAYRVTGTVRDEKGNPTASLSEGEPNRRGLSIRVRPSGASEFTVRSDALHEDGLHADGRFSLRVPYGPAKLAAVPWSEGGEIRIVWADVSPENPTADLRMPTTAKAVTVRAPAAKKGRDIAVQLEGDPGASAIWGKFGEDGRAELPRLLPGTYTIWIPAEGDDLLAYVEGVKLGEAEPTVEFVHGAPIRVRAKVPADAGPLDVHVMGPLGMPWPARQDELGVFVTGVLPPGKTWTVKAKARGPTSYLRASAEAKAGDEIELEPK